MVDTVVARVLGTLSFLSCYFSQGLRRARGLPHGPLRSGNLCVAYAKYIYPNCLLRDQGTNIRPSQQILWACYKMDLGPEVLCPWLSTDPGLRPWWNLELGNALQIPSR